MIAGERGVPSPSCNIIESPSLSPPLVRVLGVHDNAIFASAANWIRCMQHIWFPWKQTYAIFAAATLIPCFIWLGCYIKQVDDCSLLAACKAWLIRFRTNPPVSKPSSGRKAMRALICTAHFSSTKAIHDRLSTFTLDNPQLYPPPAPGKSFSLWKPLRHWRTTAPAPHPPPSFFAFELSPSLFYICISMVEVVRARRIKSAPSISNEIPIPMKFLI